MSKAHITMDNLEAEVEIKFNKVEDNNWVILRFNDTGLINNRTFPYSPSSLKIDLGNKVMDLEKLSMTGMRVMRDSNSDDSTTDVFYQYKEKEAS